MPESNYSLGQIHLPENKKLTDTLQNLSLLLSLFVFIFGIITLFFSPVIGVFFILTSFPLFVEGKIGNAFQTKNIIPAYLKIFFILISVLSSLLIILAGVLFVSGFALIYAKQINQNIGFSLLLIGLGLLFPRLKFLGRFHLAQLFAFIILIINSMVILESLYLQSLSVKVVIPYTPLFLAITFVVSCLAIILRWSARGFMSMFTTDSISSRYAFESLIVNVITIFIVGYIISVLLRAGILASYEAIALLAILLIVFTITFAWINIRLLYRLELERFVMKEELKVHNINLQLGNEDLISKTKELQKKNSECVDKLDNRENYMDIVANYE
jgi:hypothetical protein